MTQLMVMNWQRDKSRRILMRTLPRDGTGDFDGDGPSDPNEYLATTEPANAESVFRIVNLVRLSPTNLAVSRHLLRC